MSILSSAVHGLFRAESAASRREGPGSRSSNAVLSWAAMHRHQALMAKAPLSRAADRIPREVRLCWGTGVGVASGSGRKVRVRVAPLWKAGAPFLLIRSP
ncbi:hypothetical protein Cadr_000028254 [Camelus dromedarius]|uniref:Uncharacterized protein n=1 Tax=Camelus dromedarius TaxID=9838 RepID=A0A5N4CA47_CAMDR|nr:hypothetical protein Cadr_000028254 [Camelus dromedarius]